MNNAQDGILKVTQKILEILSSAIYSQAWWIVLTNFGNLEKKITKKLRKENLEEQQ